ncbi:Endothelin-converting enzyme 2, partial [Cladochytrium tenue]
QRLHARLHQDAAAANKPSTSPPLQTAATAGQTPPPVATVLFPPAVAVLLLLPAITIIRTHNHPNTSPRIPSTDPALTEAPCSSIVWARWPLRIRRVADLLGSALLAPLPSSAVGPRPSRARRRSSSCRTSRIRPETTASSLALRILVFAICVCLTLLPTNAAASESWRYRRDEEYQPAIAREFPHQLGSSRIRSWMNSSVDPCQDFYQYSCGGFIEKFKDVPHADTLELMQTSNSLLMEQILGQRKDLLSKTPSERRIFRKSVDYYRSCLNSDAINSRGFDPIIPLAKEFAGLFGKDQSFARALGRMNSRAVYLLFKTSYGKVSNADPKDLRLQIFPSTAYDVTKKTVVRALRPFVDHGILTIPHNMTLDIIAEWIVKVEKMSIAFVKALNQPSQWLTIEELSKETKMNWTEYLEPLNLTGIEKAYIWGDRKLVTRALKALSKFDRTSMGYLSLWRLATAHYSKLGKRWFNLWAKRIYTNGLVSSYDSTNDDKSDVFQYSFNETQKDAATKMIDGLFDSYREIVSNLTWMDHETRTAALKKLDNTVRVVGYPDWVGDADEIDDYYTQLSFHPDQYFENAVQAHAHYEYSSSVHQLGRELERSRVFYGYPWELNAFHLSDYVSIQINSGIIQRPIFSHRNPDLMNYGSLGIIIGHEITHSFDSLGHTIDSEGVVRPWWTAESDRRFSALADCFRRQYGGYRVRAYRSGRELSIDGSSSVSENIADNGGLNVALRAWHRMLGPEADVDAPRDDYDGFSPLQMFFIAFGQTWCNVPDYAQTRFLVKSDSHAPNEVRIRGAIANSREFQRAFSCKTGSPMSPPDKDRCFLF